MPNLFERTVITPRDLQPLGRSISLDKIYIGFVKNIDDVQRQGRLQVWIPELGGDKTKSASWVTVSYCSPFAGATNIYDEVKDNPTWSGTQTAYGMWFIPPDLENEVVCAFINGDPGRGIWFACLYNQNMNHMVPGLPGTSNTTPGLPVAEYNKRSAADDPAFNVKNPTRPIFSPLANQISLQGLQNDAIRGISNSGAQRDQLDDPLYPKRKANQIYGILTPGGSQIVYDDAPNNSFVRIRTRQGAQIVINDTVGSVYLNSANGLNWVELSGDGYIDVYSENDVSIRTQGNMNFHADGDMNFDAGGSINMKARGANLYHSPVIFLDATTASVDIIGQKTYTYHGHYQIAGQTFGNNSVLPAAAPAPDPQTNNPAAGPTGPLIVSAGKMDSTNSIAIGDEIANGFGTALGGTKNAKTAANIDTVLKNAQTQAATSDGKITTPYVVFSVGTNDDPTQVNSPEKYQALRDLVAPGSKVVWILSSKNPVSAALQKVIASKTGDSVIPLKDNPLIPMNAAVPQDYNTLVTQVKSLPVISGTIDPTKIAPSAPSMPGAAMGGVTLQNGQFIQFKQDSIPSYNGPIYEVTGVGESIKLVDTNKTAVSGEFNLETAGNVNVKSHGSIHDTALKNIHRIAGVDIYDTAISNHNRLAGQNLIDQAVGDASSRAGGSIFLSGKKIHSNGPLAPNATQASQAKGTPDNKLPDVEYDANAQKIIDRDSIVARMPTHEPYVNHLQYGGVENVPVNGRGAPPQSSRNSKSLPPLTAVSGPHLVWGTKVNNYANGGATFRGKVFDMADKLGMAPSGTSTVSGGSGADWIMTCMALETGESFNPSIRCAVSSATGLIQFMASTATGLGTTTAALASMTPEAQLDYVYRYLSAHNGKYKNIGDVYMAIFNANGIGKDDSYVLYKSPTSAYFSNHGFDTTGKGYITRGDCLAKLNYLYQLGETKYLWKP